MLIICFHTKFHVHNLNGRLVIAVKLKARTRFRTAANLPTEKLLKQKLQAFRNLLPYIIS